MLQIKVVPTKKQAMLQRVTGLLKYYNRVGLIFSSRVIIYGYNLALLL
jgi:hypothetical protein